MSTLTTLHDSELRDPYSVPLDSIDLSDPRLFSQNRWQEYFKRVRDEDPVHYIADSPFGPFWSVTRFDDIVAVDTNHQVFSSEPFIMIGDLDPDLPIENFISMDPPKHDEQRAAVQSVVAPRNLQAMEALIRQRIGAILDELPVGEAFDWVSTVSIELTSQMLATIFDFPYEERHKLPYWSDISTAAPELSGGKASKEERFAALAEMVNAFSAIWARKAAEREAGQPAGFDLISLLQASEDTRDMINRPAEFMGNLGLLIVGGNDTTRNSITGSVLAMNRFPEEFEKLRKASDRDVHNDSKETTLPIAREIVQTYVTDDVKPPWYIDLLNINLDNFDLASAQQRIQMYLDAFASDGTRITENLDFD